LVLAGLGIAVLALLLGPEVDLQHELVSRFDRLLLHQVGPAWVALAPWLARAMGAHAAHGAAEDAR
jgi:hypothetical protein